ncbi:hypothetical protein AA11825_2302 [Acetobacter pomorum DSM 11825]|uniref:hypothetical protein n=1 Tax=Acetobacter pomorum TaxID=65959 RepID=UPI00142D6D35|nr:hypothetical protein [Acetobacter pomorum]GBR52648.1 hypothetical protein AA11825_2302 [Acetobacter pomorum DSM 11825]
MPEADRADQMNCRYGSDKHDEGNQYQNNGLFKAFIECQTIEQLDQTRPVPAVPGTFHGDFFHNRFPIR